MTESRVVTTRNVALTLLLALHTMSFSHAQEVSSGTPASSFGLNGQAADAPVQSQKRSIPKADGSFQQTRSLLELQRSGKQASDNKQYISAAEMAEIYQRYIESFSHQIPEFFIQPDFTAQ